MLGQLMNWRVAVFLFVAALLCRTLPAQTTYYVDYAGGSDSYDGTEKTHTSGSTGPFQHAPGMTGCTVNCKAASVTPGSRVILKGGVTWPASCFVWNISYSGNATSTWVIAYPETSTSMIYIGVDTTWYSGNLWTRPILNAQGTTPSGPYGHMIEVTGQYLNIDNFELTGMYWNSNSTQAYYIEDDASYVAITANYFHGWSHGSKATSDNLYAIRGCNVNGCNPGSFAAYNVISGADSGKNGGNFIYASPEIAFANYCEYVGSCFVGNWCAVHDNTAFDLVQHWDGGHPDVMQANSSVPYGQCVRGVSSSIGALYYNNNFGHACAKASCGASTFVTGPWESVDYVFNNIIYNTDANQGNVFSQGKCLFCTPLGTGFFVNNTIECGPDSGPEGTCFNSNSSVAIIQNSHMITGSGTPIEAGTYVRIMRPNIVENVRKANKSGYSMKQTYPFSPTSSSSPTVASVAKGNNLTGICNSNAVLAPLCQDTTLGVRYNSTTHSVTWPARTPQKRPTTGYWDVGAYQYTSGGSSTPAAAHQ